jgi:methylmalonyl-CoA/ethylmalonyl-CoA epimerase
MSEPEGEPDSEADSEATVRGERTRLGPILQIGVSVADLETMTAFYRDALRLPFLFAAPGMSFFDCGGVRLMLSLPETGIEGGHGSILYLRSDDIAADHRELTARGVSFRGVPHVVHRAPGMELWMAFFADPEGNLLALAGEVRTS